MKKFYITIIFVILSFLSIFAQSNLREGRIIIEQKSSKQSIVIAPSSNIKDNNEEKFISNDTIYCSRTKKQHGWFAPMDTLSKEMIQRQGYYRFTRKNKAGHWLRMEILDAYGNYVKGSISPYILKLGIAAESDSKAISNWVDKLQTACICEFIADYTGETIIQERAYDENMNIIFTFSRVPIGNNQFNGSYKDCYGLPAEMRNDENYTYGTLVRITEDVWGNDSVIQYIDAKGMPKLNSDSVALEVFIHDKEGHLLKQQSRNIDGSLAIDNWGNCGLEYEWNNKHQLVKATYMDDKWQPMRMPALRENDTRDSVITTNYRYDEYGHQIEEFYTDTLGNLDINALGTHRMTYEYDEKGNVIKICGFDKDNNKSAINKSIEATEELTFDDKGNLLFAVFLDKNDKPVSTPGYLSKIVRGYDKTGKQILEEQYAAESGIEKLVYKNQKDSICEYTRWKDGSYRIDSFDYKGRIAFIGFYDTNGKFEMIGERAYERYSYVDEIGKCTKTEIDYDTLCKKTDVNGICKTITISDSLKWTNTIWRYDKNDNLIESFIHQYDRGFNRVLSQDDANTFGIKARCGGSSSVRYFTGDIVFSQNGEFASLLGRDEFDEPDYITSTYITYYYSKLFSNSETKFYDEFNNEIDDEAALRNKLPKVMTIEVIDSSAYAAGLRDNDVILLYGDYAVDINALDSTSISYYQFRRDWSLRSILDAKKDKRMVIFRIEDAKNNKYGLIEIKHLIGTPSEIGFIPHIRYLTQKQLSRIQSAVRSDITNNKPLLKESDLRKSTDTGNNFVIMAYTEMYRSVRDKPYAKQVSDPAILLGACIRNKNMYWDISQGDDTEMFESMLNTQNTNALKYPTTLHFYLTKDMQSITDLKLKDQAVYTNWFDTWISDEDYIQLMKLNNQVLSQMETIRSTPSPIKSKELYGQWEIVNATDQMYSTEGDIYLYKDGTCKGTLSSYGTISFAEGTAVYKLEKDYTGEWYQYDSLITFYPYFRDSIKVSCINFIGTDDEDLRERVITYMNSICEEEKYNILEQMQFLQTQWDYDLFISSIDKKYLKIKREGEDIIFHKTKTTPMRSQIKTNHQGTKHEKKEIATQKQKHHIVIGNIEGETGYFVEKGYQGLFIILEWCDWNCTMSVDEFSQEFEKQRDNNKHIVLLPVKSDEKGNDVFTDIIEIDCPAMRLGIRLLDQETTIQYYEINVINRYKDWLESNSHVRTN